MFNIKLTSQSSKIAGSFLLAGLLQACGGGGADNGANAGSGNDANAQERIPTTELTFFVSSMSVDHDCDPNQDNPGDFVVITKLKQNGESIKDNSSDGFTLHADGYANLVNRTLIQSTIKKQAGVVYEVLLDASERDSGSRDEDSTRVYGFQFEWDENSLCWVNQYGYCLTSEDAINWRAGGSIHHLGREDEFKLFNPDDEGCEYTVSWNMALQDDGTYQ